MTTASYFFQAVSAPEPAPSFKFMYSRHPAYRQRLHVAPSDTEHRELVAACGRRLIDPYLLLLDPEEYAELTDYKHAYVGGHVLVPCVECDVTVTLTWSWISQRGSSG